jgi:ferritin
MLSPQLLQQLNAQINLERYSANLYLQMSAWCQHKGLSGCAAFLRQHADKYMFKIIFAGKEDYSFVHVREAEDEDELHEVLEEFQKYTRIKGIKPDAYGENFMAWGFAVRKYHLFWSEVFKD